jgi:hypothetical protein
MNQMLLAYRLQYATHPRVGKNHSRLKMPVNTGTSETVLSSALAPVSGLIL